jgi:type IV pilus assembly protein PilM
VLILIELPKMQLSNFLKSVMPTTSIGVDIGSYSVKVAQIKEKRLSDKRSLSFGIKEIKPQKSHEGIVQAIKTVCDEIKIDSNKANLSIYGPDIIMRYITLPALETFDLSHCLEFELERYIPGKQKSNMVIDYKILYRLPNHQMVVLLIALERRVIEERISLIKEAGLLPNSLNVDCLALMEAFKALPTPNKDKDVVAILDIGYLVSKLVVFQDDTPYFSRDIASSGVYNFLQLMSENMGIELAHAKELLFNPQDKTKEIFEAIKANLNSLIDELRLSFEYCSRNLQKRVNRLFFSGGGSKIKMLNETLTTSLNLKASVLDVTAAFTTPSLSQDKLRELSHLIPVAVGLAVG